MITIEIYTKDGEINEDFDCLVIPFKVGER